MLLAIDTSTAQVGLALYDGVQILGEVTWTAGQHHTTELAPAVSELMRRSNVSMDKVGALGVAIGPGSFTSLRVGLSLAKGIALASHLPLIGISTLDIIAAAQPAGRRARRFRSTACPGRRRATSSTLSASPRLRRTP